MRHAYGNIKNITYLILKILLIYQISKKNA